MKRKILSILFFTYCVIASLFLTISGAFTARTVGSVVFQILFLPVVAYFAIETLARIRKKPASEENTPSLSKKQITTIIAIFIILFVFGIVNVNIKAQNDNQTAPLQDPQSSSPLVYPANQDGSNALHEPNLKLIVVIKDGSPSVNIVEKASVYSDVIGKAQNGEVYEYTQKINGWYEIKINDEEVGYIFEDYIEIENK